MIKNSLLTIIALGLMLNSCKSAQQKEADARQTVADAKQDFQTTKIDNANEWIIFKGEAEKKIAENDKNIASLKLKIDSPGNTFDGIYRTRIEKLEAKNSELKASLKNYDGAQTKWKTFKNDFNRDANELGANIKDLFR